MQTDPAGLRVTGAHLGDLIAYAYSVPVERILGGEDWIWSARFEVDAATSQPASNAEQRLMLRGLLERRFGLRVSPERRRMPVYALVVTRGGTKLQKRGFGQQPSPPRGPGGQIVAFEGETIAELVNDLNIDHKRGALARLVVDQTGIAGRYNIVILLDPIRNARGFEEPDLGRLPATLKRELGLELKEEAGTVTYYKVLSAQLPTPN